MDLAVKWRFFNHLRSGGDPDAESVYRWHIWERSGARMMAGLATDRHKRSVDDYVLECGLLIQSMRAFGFVGMFAVPIDQNGELLDGSHRVACALALGIETVPVRREDRYVWAPPWHYEWFVQHGMPSPELCRTADDFARLAL